ncbi:MAG: 3-deoxy-D-manno-octulosonic acid transferase [Candidatus Sumerlaeaceae bacterium]|nr:3-deoxy-D-manno-octulosonic acid transferase [Candidatus Sumerlaeaceae bacterium]
MIPTIFDLAYLAVSPVAAPVLLHRRITRGKYRESLPAMFGRHLDDENPVLWRNGCVWVHAVSVGEVVAARAMLPLLRARFANLPLLLTTVTETGQAQAGRLPPGLADAVRYFPADFSWVVRRFAATYRPQVFVTMETELWPNVLMYLGAVGTKAFVFNGKVGERSFARYRLAAPLLRRPLRQVRAYCMQTPADAARMAALCGDESRVFVTGNCKFDNAGQPLEPEAAQRLRRECGLEGSEKVIVAGSTHPGEEEILFDAFESLRRSHPDCVLILAPRHPERFDAVWALARQRGLAGRRLSDDSVTDTPVKPGQVVLVDRMGVLASLYGLAHVAVVAGSFVPGIGGHNLLEPAVHGVPVVFGPFAGNQPDMVQILSGGNGGVVAEPSRLADTLARLLGDEAERSRLGKAAQAALLANQGSASRNMEIMERFL